MKKAKLNTGRLLDVITIVLILVMMVIALVESIKTRIEINDYIEYIMIGGEEECVEDTSLV